MATKTRDRDEFIAIMARELPNAILEDLDELMRLSRRHCRLQEKACNEPVPDGHDRGCELRIIDLCKRIGCTPLFCGDPRACTVKLPSGRTNDWGAEGICVPQ